jgi:hypothetical protein
VAGKAGERRRQDRELYALYPATRQLSPKVRAVIDHALAARAAHQVTQIGRPRVGAMRA